MTRDDINKMIGQTIQSCVPSDEPWAVVMQLEEGTALLSNVTDPADLASFLLHASQGATRKGNPDPVRYEISEPS